MSQANFQQKDLTGVLFFNAYKDKDTQPNFKGKITIDGKEYGLSAWERKDKNGNNYYSLQATSPDEQQANAQSNIDRLKSAVFANKNDASTPAPKPHQPKPMPGPDFGDDDDDLPF